MPSDRDNVFTSIGAMLPDDVIAELGLEPYSDDARQHPRDVAQIVTRLCDGLNAARARAERAEARLAEVLARLAAKPQTIRLAGGELTADEMRAVLALFKWAAVPLNAEAPHAE